MSRMNTEKEEEMLRNRLKDLASASYRRQSPFFSDFLGLNEQNIYHSLEKEIGYAGPVLFGGYKNAERQMLGFLPDALSFTENSSVFPICCIGITLSDPRYSEKLSHRDILGAVLHLGIERNRTGDILIGEDKAYLFAEETIGRFITENLIRVRHAFVHCELMEPGEVILPALRTERIEGSISSPRLDALIPMAFHASRSSLKELAAGGKVFLNGRLITDGSTHAAVGDMISVRGLGRFRYLEEGGTSKKGRTFVVLEKFI